MALIYDIILLLILFLSLRRGWRTGIFSSLLRLAGWVVAVILIAACSKSIAQWVFENLLRQPVTNAVQAALPQELIASVNSSAQATQETLISLQAAIDSFGGLLSNATVDTSSLQQVLQLMQTDGQTLAEAITNSVLQPLVVSVVQVLDSVVILLVCLAVFKALSRSMAAHRHKRGVVGTVNSVLGAALGFGEGFAVSYVYAYILSALAGSNLSFINAEIISSTKLVQLLVK